MSGWAKFWIRCITEGKGVSEFTVTFTVAAVAVLGWLFMYFGGKKPLAGNQWKEVILKRWLPKCAALLGTFYVVAIAPYREYSKAERARLQVEARLASVKPTTGSPAPVIVSNTLDRSPVLIGNTASNISFDFSTKFIVNVTAEQVRQAIEARSESSKADFTNRYPAGYVLFGKAEGKVIYKPEPNVLNLSADWDKTELLHDVRRGLIQVRIFESVLKWGQSQIHVGEVSAVLPFAEGQPIRVPYFHIMGYSMYCEIVDIKNGIFLIGLLKQ
jgi:hypothetical protein